MAILTQAQIDKIRKDFVEKIMNIDKLKIRDEQKIYLIEEYFEGYNKGFATCAGTTFNIKIVNIVLGIGRELTKFKDQVGKVEPSIEVIELIAEYNWGEIIKLMNKIKNDK